MTPEIAILYVSAPQQIPLWFKTACQKRGFVFFGNDEMLFMSHLWRQWWAHMSIAASADNNFDRQLASIRQSMRKFEDVIT